MKMRRSAGHLVSLMLCACVFLCTSCQAPYKPPGSPIPEGFKIACYPGSTCTKSDSTPLPNKEFAQVVILLSPDDIYKIEAWYKTELTLKGFMVASDNEIKGTMTLESQNDTHHCTVTLSPIGDKNTVISISTFPKAK